MIRIQRCLFVVALAGGAAMPSTGIAAAQASDYDVIIRGGRVIDGTGNPWFRADIGIWGDRILEIGDGFVRAEAGCLMADINAALAEVGQELVIFPSTQAIATIGGFVGGGPSGIGSVATWMLRDPGNLLSLSAMSVEATPRLRVFDGDEVNQIHHAWGMNGVITEVTIRTVPQRNWIGCMATFDSYRACYAAGHALASAATIAPKLVSTVDARISSFFPRP